MAKMKIFENMISNSCLMVSVSTEMKNCAADLFDAEGVFTEVVAETL